MKREISDYTKRLLKNSIVYLVMKGYGNDGFDYDKFNDCDNSLCDEDKHKFNYKYMTMDNNNDVWRLSTIGDDELAMELLIYIANRSDKIDYISNKLFRDFYKQMKECNEKKKIKDITSINYYFKLIRNYLGNDWETKIYNLKINK